MKISTKYVVHISKRTWLQASSQHWIHDHQDIKLCLCLWGKKMQSKHY